MSRKGILILLAAAAVLAATALYAGWFHRDTGLQGSGTVEARNIRVGSKIGGRIDKVLVREGDSVQPGQVLITFDDQELRAALQESRAGAEKSQRGYRPEEIAEARAAAAQAKAEYELKKNGYRLEDIATAQADLDHAKADEIRTHLDFDRYDALERGNRREDVDLAKAAYAYDEARFRERQVTAPSAAIVEVLDVRPGDLIAPNTPVATLLEKDQIYVRIYIPETEYGRLKLGQKAEVRVDSFPKTVFEGVLEQINQQAEFLPRNVQTREERVHQVFGVKIRINDPAGHVIAGMAADVKLKDGN
jgi:RND family efflux transporter MFP subunit